MSNKNKGLDSRALDKQHCLMFLLVESGTHSAHIFFTHYPFSPPPSPVKGTLRLCVGVKEITHQVALHN